MDDDLKNKLNREYSELRLKILFLLNKPKYVANPGYTLLGQSLLKRLDDIYNKTLAGFGESDISNFSRIVLDDDSRRILDAKYTQLRLKILFLLNKPGRIINQERTSSCESLIIRLDKIYNKALTRSGKLNIEKLGGLEDEFRYY